MDANGFGQAVRGRSGVDNSLHWSIGVTSGEDQSRARTNFSLDSKTDKWQLKGHPLSVMCKINKVLGIQACLKGKII